MVGCGNQEAGSKNSMLLTHPTPPKPPTCPVLFQPMKQTCEYCTVQNIPFPRYELQEDEENLKECYLMESSQEPDAPIVLFFPLINDTFQKYKAPGKPPPSSVPTTRWPWAESSYL